MGSGIFIVPVGEVAQAVLARIYFAIQKTFDEEWQIGEPLPEPEDAFDLRRENSSASAPVILRPARK